MTPFRTAGSCSRHLSVHPRPTVHPRLALLPPLALLVGLLGPLTSATAQRGGHAPRDGGTRARPVAPHAPRPHHRQASAHHDDARLTIGLRGRTSDERRRMLANAGIRFEHGRLRARVVDATDDTLIVEADDRPGVHTTLARHDVPADVIYRIHEALQDPRTADDWLALADMAHHHALHQRHVDALRHAAEAHPADPEAVRQRLSAALNEHAEARMARARALHAAGELEQSQEHMRRVHEHFDGSPAAEEARVTLERLRAAHTEELRLTAETQRRRAAARALDPRLEAVHLRVRDAHAELEAALRLADDAAARRRLEAARTVLDDAAGALGDAPDRSLSARDEAVAADRFEATTDPVATEGRTLRLIVQDLRARVHTELARLSHRLGDHAEAVRHAELAATIDPDDPALADLRRELMQR